MQDYPKVFILSPTNLSASSATGTLMYRLFKSWPVQYIYQVALNVHTDDVASSYKNILTVNSKASYLQKRKAIISYFEENKVDVIYLRIVDFPIFYLWIALELVNKYKLPLVVHIMDDFEKRLEWTSNIIKRKIYSFFLQKILQKANGRLAISESMALAFKDRYNLDFEVFHNGIEQTEKTDFYQKKKNKENQINLLWSGSIAKTKDSEAAALLAKAVHRLNLKGYKIQLTFTVPTPFMDMAKDLENQYKGIVARTLLPLAQYPEALKNADILVLGRNSDEITKSYTEHSFQNKLTDYLSSTTPILFIGPQWDNTYKLLKKYGNKDLVSSGDVEDIQKCLVRVIESYSDRRILAFECSQKAFYDFSMDKTRQRFEQAIIHGSSVGTAFFKIK